MIRPWPVFLCTFLPGDPSQPQYWSWRK